VQVAENAPAIAAKLKQAGTLGQLVPFGNTQLQILPDATTGPTTQTALGWLLVALVPAGAIGAAVMARLAAGRVLRPVSRLTETVERIRAWVEVSDDGPGIPADDLPYIFDRFYRSAKARALPGSGLGLAIVRRIADTHDGTVEAIPLQQGMKFRISVPEIAVDSG